jgi:hypothetical protein
MRSVDASKPLPPPPSPPRSITVNPAELVGTWVGGRATESDTLTLRADSTTTYALPDSVVRPPLGWPKTTAGKWGLYPGDVLSTERGQFQVAALKDQQLKLAVIGNRCENPWVYKRVNP